LYDQRLTDDEAAAAVTFIYSHMVNCFKGAVAELLAVKPCLMLMKRLQESGRLPLETRLFVGDAVGSRDAKRRGIRKAADMHMLVVNNAPDSSVSVGALVEVKSKRLPEKRLNAQLDKHVRRLESGLWIRGVDYPEEAVDVGCGADRPVLLIDVQPSDWKLPRTFAYRKSRGGRILCVDEGRPPSNDDAAARISDDHWRITLRWSAEAIAEAAYTMTFWYLGKVGEAIYSASMPKGWEELTPAQAGQNGAKQMLYYAILRCRSSRERQRAVALYNSYAYGYALGMNYKNAKGKREMLWPEDLDEILLEGKTRDGCTLQTS
jgi:hypothetical protein